MPLASFVPGGSAGQDSRVPLADAVGGAVRVLEDADCDFMELTVGTVDPEGSAAEFEVLQRALSGTALVPECFNSFVPGAIRLVGPERDLERIDAYVGVACERVSALGGHIIVFGSGAARQIPDGFSREEAEPQLVEFLELAARHAARTGVRVAIEPLNRSESNVLNGVDEAAAMADRVDRHEVGVLADFYHMMAESERFENIPEAHVGPNRRLLHVHVADSDRLRPGSGSYDYPGFYAALRQADYDERISIECRWLDFASEVAPSIRFLRQAHEEAVAP